MDGSTEMEEDLRELRTYRDIGRRRDAIIRRLGRAGVPVGRIAAAAGMSVTRVREVLDD